MRKYSVIISSLFFVLVDQLIKLLVNSELELFEEMNIIPKLLYLTNVRNEGAAWSILDGNVLLLALIGLIALVAIYILFVHKKELNTIDNITYSLLLGGILGNLIDRIFRGYVVDYIGVYIIDYAFPIFNFADMGIVIAVMLIMYTSIKEEFDARSKN